MQPPALRQRFTKVQKILTLVVCLAPLWADPSAARISSPGFSVVSVNLASHSEVSTVEALFAANPSLQNADVYLLQEVYRSDSGIVMPAAFAERHGLHLIYAPAYRLKQGGEIGLAILSRYPIRESQIIPLPAFDLTFRSRQRIALEAIADAPSGPLTILNVHLDTRISFAQRKQQLEPLLERLSHDASRAVIGGDFNTNPFQWKFGLLPYPSTRTQASQISRLFAAKGFQSAFPLGKQTHDLPAFQLDWMFTKQWSPVETEVFPLRQSDHHALWAHLPIHAKIPSP